MFKSINNRLFTKSIPMQWTATIFLMLLWLPTHLVVADEIKMDYVLSKSIDKNLITEAKATFRVTLSTDQKDSVWLQQKMRDEVKPILELMNQQVEKIVQEANVAIGKAGKDDAKKQQIIFELNSNFEVLVAFTKDAVEYELQQKLIEWGTEKAELKSWKIVTTYEIIRDLAANSFSLATAIGSGGVTEALTVVDFLKRSVNIGKNLKDRLISEYSAREELEKSLLKYIDQISAVKPPVRPTTAQRFANLFTDSPEASFEKKLMLYQYKLTALQMSLEKMSTQLNQKLDNKIVTDATKVAAYEKACDELIKKIADLSQSRLDEGRNLVQVCKQISSNNKAQQSQARTEINAQRNNDSEAVSKTVDTVLTLSALVDPLSASLTLFEATCDAIVAEVTKSKPAKK